MSYLSYIWACLMVPLGLFGFWDLPHAVVAEIAYKNLRPEVKSNVDKSVTFFAEQYPKLNTFALMSLWADEGSTRRHFPFLSSCHYINYQYTCDCKVKDLHLKAKMEESEEKDLVVASDASNVLHAINASVRALRSPDAPIMEKAFLLAVLSHCVGDAHQPLHCATIVNEEFPQGDRGGTRFTLRNPKWRNLHACWDDGAGVFEGLDYRKNPEKINISQLAEQVMKKHPKSSFSDKLLGELRPSAWVKEGFNIAKREAYTNISPGENPSKEYVERAKARISSQMALAGYRLAAILNGEGDFSSSSRRGGAFYSKQANYKKKAKKKSKKKRQQRHVA